MSPEDWHRAICLVVGGLAWSISQRKVSRFDLAGWIVLLREVADDMEKRAG